MTFPSLRTHPSQATEVFLILHEHARRPEGREYEYMTGQLRHTLERTECGRALTEEGERRAREMGKRLSHVDLAFIVTEGFITPRETARLVAEEAANGERIPIIEDPRVRESDLSHLSRPRFDELSKQEREVDPSAAIRDWMQQRPEDFNDLVAGHIELWNQFLDAHAGKRFAFVLHVEGLLLYPLLLLGLQPEKITCLLVPRAHPVHVRLYAHRDPLLSFGDEDYWRVRPLTIFDQYS